MKQFVVIYLEWLEALTVQEAVVYAYIYAFTKNGKPFDCKLEDFSRLLSMNRYDVRKSIEALMKKGCLERKRTSHSCRYITLKIDPEKCKFETSRSSKLKHHEVRKSNIMKSEIETSQVQKSNFTPYNNNILSNGGNNVENRAINFETLFLKNFLEHYRKNFSTDYVPDYRFQTTDAATISEAVQSKMKDFDKDPESETDATEFIIDMLDAMLYRADRWQRDHWSLHTIATQFNQLYQKAISNGKIDNTDHTNARDNLADFYEEARKRYGAK